MGLSEAMERPEPKGKGTSRRALRRAGLMQLCLAFLAACAVAPVGPPHRVASHALGEPETTALGRVFAREARNHPGLSGFELVTSGREAFEARYGLARLAERTLDVQYYLWVGDATGRRMLQALLDAADRGVRVRLLLDDVNLEGKDINLATLNAHPNISVRLFNPFAFRDHHAVDYFVDFARVNHRMHNKAFIIDNSVAIVGGRNIGDQYFSVNGQSNFRDVDLLTAGPVVRDVSTHFDEFWNSSWATSIHVVTDDRPAPEELKAMTERLHRKIAEDTAYPFKTNLGEPALERFVAQLPGRLVWGKATVFADSPDKPETSEAAVVAGLREEIRDRLRSELLLEVAYFVPAGNGTAHLCELVRRGVQIRVLTNSLASTDEPAAYAGFMNHREALLRCGVELHELRPDAKFVERDWKWLKGRSEAELHTKAAVFDRREVMIGSFNMDPRSARLNTELAVFVDSPELAAKVANFIGTGMALGNAYRLQLDGDGDVVWIAGERDGEVTFEHEPGIGFWPRLGVRLISLLPIEELL
jgi:cardiolipin synthase C